MSIKLADVRSVTQAMLAEARRVSDGGGAIAISRVAPKHRAELEALAGGAKTVTLAQVEKAAAAVVDALEGADRASKVDGAGVATNVLRRFGMGGKGDGKLSDDERQLGVRTAAKSGLSPLATQIIALADARGKGQYVDGLDRLQALVPNSKVETLVKLDYPAGNVTVLRGATDRVFMSYHPDGNKGDVQVGEIVGGKVVPFPSIEAQKTFRSVLGVKADTHGRVWVLDYADYSIGVGKLGRAPTLRAFDAATKDEVVSVKFDAASFRGSMLNDLAISPDGKTVYIADTNPIPGGGEPAFVVVDLTDPSKPSIKRRLEGDASTRQGDYNFYMTDPAKPGEPARKVEIGGVLDVKVGLDGLALSKDGQTMYFCQNTGGVLYKVPTAALRDIDDPAELSRQVKVVTRNFHVSDGITVGQDPAGREVVYTTGVESGSILRVDAETGAITKLVQDEARMHWPDSVALGSGGDLYFNGSVLDRFIGPIKPSDGELAKYRDSYFNILRTNVSGVG